MLRGNACTWLVFAYLNFQRVIQFQNFPCSALCFKLFISFSGIPTSRAAALVVSDDTVIRDQFYNGRPELERAAIVMRIAPSFLRFGSLEILARNNEIPELRKLLDFILVVSLY